MALARAALDLAERSAGAADRMAEDADALSEVLAVATVDPSRFCGSTGTSRAARGAFVPISVAPGASSGAFGSSAPTAEVERGRGATSGVLSAEPCGSSDFAGALLAAGVPIKVCATARRGAVGPAAALAIGEAAGAGVGAINRVEAGARVGAAGFAVGVGASCRVAPMAGDGATARTRSASPASIRPSARVAVGSDATGACTAFERVAGFAAPMITVATGARRAGALAPTVPTGVVTEAETSCATVARPSNLGAAPGRPKLEGTSSGAAPVGAAGVFRTDSTTDDGVGTGSSATSQRSSESTGGRTEGGRSDFFDRAAASDAGSAARPFNGVRFGTRRPVVAGSRVLHPGHVAPP